MEFLRLGPVGGEIPAVRTSGGSVCDLRTITSDIHGEFFEADGVARTRQALREGSLATLDDPGDGSYLRIGAPIARPTAVICIGQNYAAHARESGGEPPAVPVVFFKHPNTVVGPYDPVPIPPGSTKTDWEVELAVVIGRRARHLASPTAALGHVAGYAISNDVSERTYQLEQSGGQWSKGKCYEAFNPLGPVLVPPEEIPDPRELGLRSWVNGSPRQASTTADMIFPVGYLIWHLSQFMTLEPGDLINTGTPEGVALSGRFPYLVRGDVMELQIDQLGLQRQQLCEASASTPAA
jgi:2-keto-4-pentenoate hydratase/2-oxohepta-3-ene-1,7-dioic acid hydratase in catechol pathway